MTVPCDEAVAYVIGPDCHKLADLLAARIPGVDGGDVVAKSYLKVRRRFETRCPDWASCPLVGGTAAVRCLIVEEGDGRTYLRVVVRNAARSLAQAGWGGPHRLDGGLVDEDGEPRDDPRFLVDDEVATIVHKVDRAGALRRLHREAKEDPAQVWPEVNSLRIEVKVEAAAMVFRGQADDVGTALRRLDPAHYVDPDNLARARRRVARDATDVRLVLRYVWERENPD